MELVERLIKINILYVREEARNKFIRLKNMGQLTEPINVKSNPTLLGSAKILQCKIDRVSKIPYLKDSISTLCEDIENSTIKNIKYWNDEKLSSLAINRLFYMDTNFTYIKEAESITGISQSAIKQACQNEKLLNTKKMGRAWLVHLPEIINYWQLQYDNDNFLFNNWEY